MATIARPDTGISLTPPATPAPTIDPATVDLHSPAYLSNPYVTYAGLRRSAPVVHLAPYPGVWAFRHADVLTALNDQDTFRKQPIGGSAPLPGVLGAMDALPNGVFSSDPPRHTAIRSIVEPPMRAAFAHAPQVAGAVIDMVLGGITAGRTRRLELMSDYALAVPSTTLFTLLGLRDVCIENDPTNERWMALVKQLIGLVTAVAAANDITQSAGVQMMGGMSAMALNTFCQGVMRKVEATPDGTTPLHQMLANAKATGYGAIDVQTSLVNFIVAGYLSTTFLIGSGTLNLLNNPTQLAALRDDPSLIGAAVREMLRMDAPAQLVDRVVATETSLSGVTLPVNTRVTLVLGSANHDETVFANADAFDMMRTDGAAAVPFGAGIHHCIGSPLVHIVAPLAIGRLVAAFPNMAVDGLVTWQTDPYLRAPASLPLAV